MYSTATIYILNYSSGVRPFYPMSVSYAGFATLHSVLLQGLSFHPPPLPCIDINYYDTWPFIEANFLILQCIIIIAF